MKFNTLAGILVIGSVWVSPATAQSLSITIGPEERTHIREYVVRERVPPVNFRERVVVGTRIASDVELRPVPERWGPRFARYHYFYSDDRVVLVDPEEREVVYVLE